MTNEIKTYVGLQR